MSDTTETETDTNTDTTDEPSKAELHDRVQQLESTVEKLMPSRRDALKLGAAGIAGAAGLRATTQPADASTGSAGQIGDVNNRPDVFADTVDTNSLAGVSTGIGDDYLSAEEFSGSDADSRLDSALTAASTGDVIFLESEPYTQDRTISIEGLRLVGAGASEFGTGISATFTLAKRRISMMHFALRDPNINQGEIILDASSSARMFIMNTVFGDITINAGNQESIIAFTRQTNITDNGIGNIQVGNT